MAPPADRPAEGVAGREQAVLLDLLRALAAIFVLLVHVRGLSFVDFAHMAPSQQNFSVAVVFGLTHSGQEAVIVFFVLSGLLVGGQLITRVMRGDFSLAEYAIDRCTRILLPLVPACLFTAALDVFWLDTPVSLWSLVGSMIGLNGVVTAALDNNNPLWTLPYEIWFYVLGGAIAYLVATFRRRVSLLNIMVLGACVLVFVVLRTSFLLIWMLGALMTLCLGMRHPKGLAVLGLAIALVGGCFLELALPSHSLLPPSLVSEDIAIELVAIGACLLLPACSQLWRRGQMSALTRVIRSMSSISYSLYLIHFPVLCALDRFLPKATTIDAHSLRDVAVRLAACLAVTLVFYWLFERNTPALRRYLRRVRAARALASPGPSPAFFSSDAHGGRRP
jgi:peptidoglycan/LPS O-acetylase OafA/YrhL